MINVTVGEQKTQSEKPFPKLMISTSDRIVFMIKYSHGFMLHDKGEGRDIGYYCESWSMEDFTDYNEPITIQNQ